MRYLSLDLELTQPICKIIEVGYAVGDLHDPVGTVLDQGSMLVDPKEPLTEFIVKLTGITDEMIQANPIELSAAHAALVEVALKYEVCRNLLTWGGDDGACLKRQLNLTDPKTFWFAPTVMDVKKVYQFLRHAYGQKVQSGLAKSLTKCGISFKGKRHRAMDDALNTLFIAQFLTAELKRSPIQLKP